MPLAELQNLMNDFVADSPHLGRTRVSSAPYVNYGGSRLAQMRPLDDLEAVAAKRFERGEGFGCGRGSGGCRGRTSPNTCRIDFNAIDGALNPHERKRHQGEGLFSSDTRRGTVSLTARS